MRLLHTADWHVGKTLRGRPRLDEFAGALDQVARRAIEAKVDAVLVAGDVFDSPAPPPEAERLVYDFFARLLPDRISCVVIAGNHDNPRRLAALARLLESLHIHVRSEVRPASEGGVVTVPSRDGSQAAKVAVVPFVPERKLVDACQVMEPEYTWYETYAARLEQILQFLTKEFTAETVNVVLGHVLIDGVAVGTGVRQLHLGQIYGMNAQQLPGNAQYIGLGHLHRPQEVPAPSRTFYPGSLLELDFGEAEQDKKVILVDVQPRQPATVEWIPITAGRRLRDVAGTLAELQAMAGTLGRSDFLRVRVRAEAPVPGLAEQVREMLPGAVDVRLEYEREERASVEGRLGRLGPLELFTEFYRQANGAEPPDEMLSLFRNVYEEAMGG